jgi:serpin B
LRDKVLAQHGKEFTIDIANGLWVQKGYPLQPSFLQTAKSSYDADAREVDFEADTASARQAVNGWISERTRGKIKEILDPADLDANTRLVLASAIYFKGDWVNSFPPKGTRKDRFYRKPGDFVDVSMMGQLAMFPYLETDSYQAMQLPYAGKHLSMCIFLPGSADGLPEFTKTMTNDKLSELLGKMARTEINVFLPRFKTRFRTDLKEPLKNMGMQQAFNSGKADFTGISAKSLQKLQIAKVIHEAVVEVNEAGTEAAGATALEVAKSDASAPAVRHPPTFRADRPFLFVIRHDATGSILFVGRVADPNR